MKAFAIFLLSGAVVLGADDDLRLFTQVQQLSWGATNIVDYYMRAGETNLVRTMLIAQREPLSRFHQFFHGGEFLGCYVTGTNSSGCITYPSSRYMLSFSFGPSNDLRAVVVGNAKGEVVDAFGCTNGVITPVTTSMLRQAELIDMRQFVHPESIRRRVWGEAYSQKP